jgi:hypothetical protein
MTCEKCGNDDGDKYCFPPEEGNDQFETLEYESSTSNWDDWDFCGSFKCKKCGHIRTVSQ